MKPTILNSIFQRLFRREAVSNTQAAADDIREACVANAADAPIDGEDAAEGSWHKIAPYGTYPGSRPGRPQHFTEVEANAVVAEFHSALGQVRRMFRGIPIFIGHPTIPD